MWIYNPFLQKSSTAITDPSLPLKEPHKKVVLQVIKGIKESFYTNLLTCLRYYNDNYNPVFTIMEEGVEVQKILKTLRNVAHPNRLKIILYNDLYRKIKDTKDLKLYEKGDKSALSLFNKIIRILGKLLVLEQYFCLITLNSWDSSIDFKAVKKLSIRLKAISAFKKIEEMSSLYPKKAMFINISEDLDSETSWSFIVDPLIHPVILKALKNPPNAQNFYDFHKFEDESVKQSDFPYKRKHFSLVFLTKFFFESSTMGFSKKKKRLFQVGLDKLNSLIFDFLK